LLRSAQAVDVIMRKIPGNAGQPTIPGATRVGLRRGRKFPNMANDVIVPIRFRQKPAFLGEPSLMRAGTRRGKKQGDFGPVLRGMVGKGDTVHGAGHMYIGKQHVDARGVDLKNAQSGFGVFGLDHVEARILQRSDDNQADQFFVFGHKDENLARHLFDSQNGTSTDGNPFGLRLPSAL
jgi:hypothetical protein